MSQPHNEYDAIAAAAPVHIHGRVQIDGVIANRPQAAEFGSGGFLTFNAQTPAQQILPRDPNRARALISCSSTAGLIYVGSKAQAQAGTPLGFPLKDGAPPMEIRSQQEVWAVWDGTHAATVGIWVEQWQRTA